MVKKQVTNEELARMIAEGFDDVTSKMATKTELKEGLEEISVKIEAIDTRLRTVETKLDKALYTEINLLEARLKKVEEKVGIK